MYVTQMHNADPDDGGDVEQIATGIQRCDDGGDVEQIATGLYRCDDGGDVE